jgi:transposase
MVHLSFYFIVDMREFQCKLLYANIVIYPDTGYATIESVGCKWIYLPLYSPDLNPSEKFCAKAKGWIR